MRTMRVSRVGGGGWAGGPDPTLKNHKNIGVLAIAVLGLELAIDPPPPGGILNTMIF